jgi:hypothetical protein
MNRYLPIALGVLLIVGLTIVQARMTDRLAGANVTAEQRAELLKNVPKNIGDWKGTDLPIDEAVKKTAGAVGAVSRQYRNARTGEVVDLWLIVGHGRAISAHTPDICYRSSGFSARASENSVYPMMMEDESSVPFLTNTFFREDVTGRRLVRVFWSWYNTENKDHEGKVVWEAPSNSRWYFGNTRALYKMYFTSQMRDQAETAEQSPCVGFAKEFIPVVNEALKEVYGDSPKVAGGESANPPSESVVGDVLTDEETAEKAQVAPEAEKSDGDAAEPATKDAPKAEAPKTEPSKK